jgi:hypothetical protein
MSVFFNQYLPAYRNLYVFLIIIKPLVSLSAYCNLLSIYCDPYMLPLPVMQSVPLSAYCHLYPCMLNATCTSASLLKP